MPDGRRHGGIIPEVRSPGWWEWASEWWGGSPGWCPGWWGVSTLWALGEL